MKIYERIYQYFDRLETRWLNIEDILDWNHDCVESIKVNDKSPMIRGQW